MESKSERLRREAEEAELQEQLMGDMERERQRMELVRRRLGVQGNHPEGVLECAGAIQDHGDRT